VFNYQGSERNPIISLRFTVRDMRAVSRVLVEKPVENTHLKDLGLNGKIILKRIFNKFASHCERG